MNTRAQGENCRIAEAREEGGWTTISAGGWSEYIRPETFERQERDWDNEKWNKALKSTKERINETLEQK